MYADRVHVFHRADGDDVAFRVTDDLKFDLFPAGDALLYQNLGNWRQTQTVACNLAELCLIVCDTAAGTAHGERRTDDDRVLNLFDEGKTILHGVDNLGRDTWLPNLFHGVFKHLAVLCLVDGQRISAQQLYIMLFQKAFFCQLHREGQTGLTTQSGQHAVRFFQLDDPFDHIDVQRLDVYMVCHRFIGHDGSRVRVDQNNLQTLLLEGAARLGACVVKLGCLTDDDRTGTDDQYFFNILS